MGMSARVGAAALWILGTEATMVRKDLARRIEELVASYWRELDRAVDAVVSKIRNDESWKDKRKLLVEALKKGDTSAPVVREWVRLAERDYPNVPWRRILCLDADEEEESAQGKTSESEKSSG